MKISFSNTLFLTLLLVLSFGFSSIYEDEKIHLKIIKNDNGEKSIFEKTYASMDDMKADEDLKAFDVLVKNWTDNHSKGTILNGENEVSWKAENEKILGDGIHIIIKKKEAGEENTQREGIKVIKIKTDREEKVFTITSDGASEHKMSWNDEDGNKTAKTEEIIEEFIKELPDGEKAEINREIKNLTSNESNEKNKVIIMNGDQDDVAEIEVKIEKEVDENGNEIIKEEKVWINKDGKKVERNDYDEFEIKTEGNKMTLEVEKKINDIAEFSVGEFEGESVMVFQSQDDDDTGAKQTMNINIEEKNGKKYIEIDIKRKSTLHVTISPILKNDKTLHDVKIDLKSNLKPSDLNYFPNPNNGKFHLKFDLDNKEDVTVRVMDILGNEMYKEKILDFTGKYENEINLIGKEKGIYILRINQKKKALSRKILIE